MLSGLPADARRVLVYGVTGSGKTTLAKQIASRTGLPWHSVDELTWRPGWVEVPKAEQRQAIEQICAAPAWILDTAYGTWLDVPLGSVDVIVALDYPRWFSLQRLVRRTVRRLIDKKPICNGNVETLRQAFSGDSIVVWHFRSFANKRRRIRAWVDDPAGPTVIRLTSARRTQKWLATLAPGMRGHPRPSETITP